MPVSTKYNKAVAAGVAPAIAVLCIAAVEYFTGETLGTEVRTAIVTVATAALVYAVPNKQPEPPRPPVWDTRRGGRP